MLVITNSYKYLLYLFILMSTSFGQALNADSYQLISDQDYITGEDGVVRMYVNILGHVEHPGTFLVYDGIDFISLIALAGGMSKGANLEMIKIFNDNDFIITNFNNFLNNGKINDKVIIKPHTTIYVEETRLSNLFRGSNLLNSVLQILNIALTIERTSSD